MNDDKVSKAFSIDILQKAQYELEQKEKQIRINEIRTMSVSNKRPITQRMMGSVRHFSETVKNTLKDPKGAFGLWTLDMREKYKILKQKLREDIKHRLDMLEKEKLKEMEEQNINLGGKYKNPKKSRKLHHRLKRKRLRTRRRHMHRLR